MTGHMNLYRVLYELNEVQHIAFIIEKSQEDAERLISNKHTSVDGYSVDIMTIDDVNTSGIIEDFKVQDNHIIE